MSHWGLLPAPTWVSLLSPALPTCCLPPLSHSRLHRLWNILSRFSSFRSAIEPLSVCYVDVGTYFISQTHFVGLYHCWDVSASYVLDTIGKDIVKTREERWCPPATHPKTNICHQTFWYRCLRTATVWTHHYYLLCLHSVFHLILLICASVFLFTKQRTVRLGHKGAGVLIGLC